MHRGNTLEQKMQKRPALQVVTQEADYVVCLHSAHHAPLAIDHSQCMQIVLVEELGQLILMKIDWAR